MIKRRNSRNSIISSIFGFSSSRLSRGDGIGRLQLFGMSGTFGHGVERHRDNWEIGDPAPDKVTVRKSMKDLANQRRSEASDRISEQREKGFYDFNFR